LPDFFSTKKRMPGPDGRPAKTIWRKIVQLSARTNHAFERAYLVNQGKQGIGANVKGLTMNRTLASLLIACSISALAIANAQSPDPALLAPGSSGSMLTPRPFVPRTTVAPQPGGAVRDQVIPRVAGLALQAHARR
jgi:hypothetical protein